MEEEPNSPEIGGSMLSLLDDQIAWYGRVAYRQNRAGRRWNRASYVFGLSSAVLAAVAGLGFLGDLVGATVAGWLALAAAAVGTANAFLRSDEMATKHRAKGRAIARVAAPLEALKLDMLAGEDVSGSDLAEAVKAAQVAYDRVAEEHADVV